MTDPVIDPLIDPPEAGASPSPADHQDGFTLIEMIVVVAIIALMSIFILPNVSSYFQLNLNSATRAMASTIKETFNQTALTSRVFRIAYDLKKNEYWVEGGTSSILLDTQATREKEERKKKLSTKIGDTVEASPFNLDKNVTRKKVGLPNGVTFEDIITEHDKDPIKDGVVYTHFFPQGITEQAIIHLQDQADHHISLVISPLIGRTELYNRYVTRGDVFGK